VEDEDDAVEVLITLLEEEEEVVLTVFVLDGVCMQLLTTHLKICTFPTPMRRLSV
jgi:hypothetical protein